MEHEEEVKSLIFLGADEMIKNNDNKITFDVAQCLSSAVIKYLSPDTKIERTKYIFRRKVKGNTYKKCFYIT